MKNIKTCVVCPQVTANVSRTDASASPRKKYSNPYIMDLMGSLVNEEHVGHSSMFMEASNRESFLHCITLQPVTMHWLPSEPSRSLKGYSNHRHLWQIHIYSISTSETSTYWGPQMPWPVLDFVWLQARLKSVEMLYQQRSHYAKNGIRLLHGWLEGQPVECCLFCKLDCVKWSTSTTSAFRTSMFWTLCVGTSMFRNLGLGFRVIFTIKNQPSGRSTIQHVRRSEHQPHTLCDLTHNSNCQQSL